MPPSLAVLITLIFISWLFSLDREETHGCSRAIWIPLLWLLILGSRPISAWFNPGEVSEPVNFEEGSPFDRNVFLGLILAGIVVLLRRRGNWGAFIARNPWLVIYFAYLGLSIGWSDYPFVAFKRWFKDVGNVIMVLVVLSEPLPLNAARLILARSAYILIPFSVILIKYFPDLGRYYNPFVWTAAYGGVTMDKNTLGMTLFMCGIGIAWRILDLWKERSDRRTEFYALLLISCLCLWLWHISKCATSLAATVIGLATLIGLNASFIRKRFARGNFWVLGAVLLTLLVGDCFLIISSFFNPLEAISGVLGRDSTLTGRTDIWNALLQSNINPIIGAGYGSFWQPERGESVSKSLGFLFSLKEAHNGYLEVYLNSGFVGLTLLAIMLVDGARKILKRIPTGDSLEAFRFVLLIGAVVYNMTESAFGGLVVTWFLLLLAITEFPRPMGTNNHRPGLFMQSSRSPGTSTQRGRSREAFEGLLRRSPTHT